MFNLNLNSTDIQGRGGAPLPEGKFLITVQKLIYKPSQRNGGGGSSVFVAEFDVSQVFVQMPRRFQNPDGKTTEFPEVAPGARKSWTADTKHGQITAMNIKQFFVALMGVDPANAQEIQNAVYPNTNPPQRIDWDQLMAYGIGQTNPFMGAPVLVSTSPGQTGKGFWIMRHDWQPMKFVDRFRVAPAQG